MQCEDFEAVLGDDLTSPLSREARAHLDACNSCRELFAGFSAIALAAKRIPPEVNPPERVWVALRAQLEAEGVIHEPQVVEPASPASWWSGFASSFRPRVLATVVGGFFLIAGSVYVFEHQTRQPVQPPRIAPTGGQANSAEPNKTVEREAAQTVSEPTPAPKLPASPGSRAPRPVLPRSEPRVSTTQLSPSPSENAFFGNSAAVLTNTESALPTSQLTDNETVDVALRQNLRTLNEFILECETRLKHNPQDQLTREYLNMAYQQKAELLHAMLDSGRSEH